MKAFIQMSGFLKVYVFKKLMKQKFPKRLKKKKKNTELCFYYNVTRLKFGNSGIEVYYSG